MERPSYCHRVSQLISELDTFLLQPKFVLDILGRPDYPAVDL
jgi:hypothetical protein